MSGPAGSSQRTRAALPGSRPERFLTLIFVATSSLFGFAGTTVGAIFLGRLSGVDVNLGGVIFSIHPYLQVFGFLFEFVIGVEYSLLPRFKATKLSKVWLAYLTYCLLTTSNLLYLLYPLIVSKPQIEVLASVLLLLGTITFGYQMTGVALLNSGGFSETNLLVVVSIVSSVLSSLLLLLEEEGSVAAQGSFSPALVYLALVGFVASMIYAVEIRSVSFRQCNYRKGWARASGWFQSMGVLFVFLGAVAGTKLLYLVGALAFVSGALAVLVSIKILELAHPLMYRPAMTKVHFRIMRYNEVCMLFGSTWLLIGLVLGMVELGFNMGSFFVSDTFIHSIAIGFAGSIIVCFAPMLLPGLLGNRGPIAGLSFGPILTLNLGMFLRLVGNAEESAYGLPVWESVSGPLVIISMVWFLIMVHRLGRRPAEQPRTPASVSALDPKKLEEVAEVRLTVKGRRTGKKITLPVWFVATEGTLYFLPSRGKSTQWYKNISGDGSVTVDIEGRVFDMSALIITSEHEVRKIVELFKDKYGERNFYNLFGNRADVAVSIKPR